MDPKAIKAGIARFLLRNVSRALPNDILENPFSKLIKLPQMMGFDNRAPIGKFSKQPPLYYWHEKNVPTWSPNSREQAACVFTEGCIVLIGGLNGVMLQDINVFNIQKNRWFSVKFTRRDQQPEPRYGHTAVSYRSDIYLYGGYRRYVESFKERDTYGDVYQFWTDSLKWDKLNCNGEFTFRRNHIAMVIGKYMIVHGGINQKSMVLDDIYSFDFKKKYWEEVKITGKKPKPVSHHSWCLVMHPYMLNQHNLDLYKCHIPSKKLENPTIKEMGLYLFGGDWDNNDLWILKVGVPQPYWLKPKTKGVAPSPRYGHSMHFVEFMSWVIIFGGRTPSSIYDNKNTEYIHNDMWLLKTATLEWIKVGMKGQIPKPVYSHNSWVFGSEFIIFGGINDNKLNDNVLNVWELHFARSRELIENDEFERLKEERMEKYEKDLLKYPGSDNSRISIKLSEPMSPILKTNSSNFKKQSNKISFIEDEQKLRRQRIIMEHLDKLENEEYSFLHDSSDNEIDI